MPKRKKNESLPELTECPICKRDRKSNEFEVHHVVGRAAGGSNDPVNLLSICNTCHAIVTRGCDEDANPRLLACFFHQLAWYGLNFLLKSGLKDSHPVWGKYIRGDVEIGASELDDGLKEAGWAKYFEFIKEIEQQAYYIPLPQMVKWGPPEKLAALNSY